MGKLWNEGANKTVDFVITRPSTGKCCEMIAIKRRTGEWAIPGGFIEKGEHPKAAALRELKEEAGVGIQDKVIGSNHPYMMELYEGKVEDPRNTDDRWIETTLFHLSLSSEEAATLTLKAGSDAQDVMWLELSPENIEKLYADHPRLIQIINSNSSKWSRMISSISKGDA